MTNTVTEVVFDDGAIVSLDGAMAYATRAYANAKQVIWSDGSKSWAKSWMFWSLSESRWVCCRIGAGAYGNHVVAEMPYSERKRRIK